MRRTVIAAAVLLLLGGVAVTSTASAAPTGPEPQADTAKCAFPTDGGGYVTCPLTDPVDNKPDAVAFVTIAGPTGGLPNLPSSVRFVRFILDEPTGTRITAVQWRVFGHQLVQDPNGNFRQNVYANLSVTLFQKVMVEQTYCAANVCS